MGKLICGNWIIKACGVFLLCAATAIALPAQTFTTLHSFDATDGSRPTAALVQSTNGDFYGTTEEGGTNNGGTVFIITLSDTLTTLYNFCSQSNCTDGELPYAGLVQATDGTFYGTTEEGGANGFFYGTVFKITPSRTPPTLQSFNGTDGAVPDAGLVQATDGNFYGTTADGGEANGHGTVFKITPGGTLTTLHSFDFTDGANPDAGLVQATNGDFYGTTDDGGATNGGTVFKITSSGTLTTLYNFCSQSNCTDGEFPNAVLVQGTDGNFYGTTSGGGADNACAGGNGCGTVFKITPKGTLTTLHRFDGTDGGVPYAGLVQGTDGNFYGTTEDGGTHNRSGTVFKITPSGTLTVLYSFCSRSGCADGQYPDAALVQDTNGIFYGTASGGGNNFCNGGCGTVFSLSVGLGPFVETNPAVGEVGKAVKILGTNLTGTTSVTFNGTSATFTVVSASEITTTVPAGATTGTVQVVTPGGTLSSNVPFHVRP